MAKNKRSGSEVRQRTKVITLRVNNRVASEIRRRAKNEGLTISEYIRTASLNNKIKQNIFHIIKKNIDKKNQIIILMN